MYKCSVCGLGVLVRELESPIRACDCTITETKEGIEIKRLAPITIDMQSNLEGKSSMKG